MKKVIMTAALAIAAFASAQAGSANSVNTMVVAVPEILSVTAVPGWQGVTLTEGELDAVKNLTTAHYTIKSNATYNVNSVITMSFVPTNTSTPGEISSSEAQFKNSIEFSIDGSNWASMTQLGTFGLNPLTINNQPHTGSVGAQYDLHARINNLGWSAIPGVYTTTATVTVTQP